MSQPTSIRSGHLARRFSPAFCLLLLATLASAGCRATWRTSAGGRAGAPPARGQADKVDEYIEAEMLKQHIPGLSLGVVQGAKVVKIKAYGLANIELNVPAILSNK
jgi:CubicO group peptidase (beta-lactamase class C family)